MSANRSHTHGPWIDIHSHPGRCFLGGVSPTAGFASTFGPATTDHEVRLAKAGEVAVVNVSTVADLVLLGLKSPSELGSIRDFEPGEARADHDRQLQNLAALASTEGIRGVRSASDIADAFESGDAGVFVSCEGADFLDHELEGLADAYEMGARSIGLVHYRINELGDIQTEDPKHGGLTAFGRAVVEEMNALGMIVDMAHATFETTLQAIEASTQPVMLSHSHLAAPGSNHPRLLSVDHARAVAESGGIVGAWPSGVACESLADYAGEICRLVDAIGVDHVAIGSDMDANYKPVLTSYDQFPELAVMLGERGLDTTDVDKILGGNFVRLFETVVG